VNALLRLARRLLSKEQRRFIKFCLVGGSGVPVNLIFTWVGYQVLFSGLHGEARKAAAYVLGILISILTNFLLNDLWTWKDRHKAEGRFVGRLLRFYLVSSVAALLQFGTAMGLSIFFHLHYLVAQLCGIAVATAVNFVVNNAWTFRSQPPPDDIPASPDSESDPARTDTPR
jgi:dolichol-phosphate mannosyltransferase